MVRSTIDRTWAIVGVGGSPRVTSSKIPGEEDQVGPCEQLDTLFLFNPLQYNKKNKKPWTDPHHLHPVGTTRSPQRCRKYSGATDRPYNLIEEVKHFSCLLYLAVRVGEGRQLILVKTEKSGEKEKRVSIFFS